MALSPTSIKLRHPIATSWKNRRAPPLRRSQYISIFPRDGPRVDGRPRLSPIFLPFQRLYRSLSSSLSWLNFISNKQCYVSMPRFTQRLFFPRLFFPIIIRLRFIETSFSLGKGTFTLRRYGAVLHLLLLNGESGELGLVRLTSATVIYLYSFSNRVNEAIPTIS